MASSTSRKQTLDLHTIGAVAKQAGVTVRTLRYYEELGLIGPVKRTDSQYRLYDNGVIRRVKAILALQDLGYSLEQSLVVLGVYHPNDAIDRTTRLTESEASLQQIMACIDERMAELTRMRTEMHYRLSVLQTVCHPCTQHKPSLPCDTDCSHREAHMD
jgi:DNA-binding transcriptional MerR regulator